MGDDQKRPEATHRQRVDLGKSTLPMGDDGRPMAVIQVSASDLIPTVQFGNVLIQTSIMRAVHDGPMTDEERAAEDEANAGIIERARRLSQAAQFVVSAERRIIQWAIDPSTRVINPGTGAVLTPDGEKPPSQVTAAPPSSEAPTSAPTIPDPGVVQS